MSSAELDPRGSAVGWQRLESAGVAGAITVLVIAAGQPWWVLLAAFLAFDVSALGYLLNPRVGALCYNLVHNYFPPAILAIGWSGLELVDLDADWVLLLACCWGFHVAVDRAVGYGLKLGALPAHPLGCHRAEAAG